jgi:hypothetical protein
MVQRVIQHGDGITDVALQSSTEIVNRLNTKEDVQKWSVPLK